MNTQGNNYYNTTSLKGEELKKARSKSLTQDEQVLAYFKSYDNLGATPERVLRHFRIMEKLSERKWHNTPITSIRRSFSNLRDKGFIRKTDILIMGNHGKRVHIWKLVKQTK